MVSEKYHINPEQGPLPCNAEEGPCRYKEQPHYEDKDEAQAAFTRMMYRENNPLASHKKAKSLSSKTVLPPKVAKLNAKLESSNFSQVKEFSGMSEKAHGALGKVIESRSKASAKYAATMKALNPYKKGNKAAVSKKTYDELMGDLESYQAQTSEFLKAYTESHYYQKDTVLV